MLAFIKYLGEGGLAILLVGQLFVSTGYVMDKATRHYKAIREYDRLRKLNKLLAMQNQELADCYREYQTQNTLLEGTIAELLQEINNLQRKNSRNYTTRF